MTKLTDEDLRLSCIDLANKSGIPSTTIIKQAQEYYDFVTQKKSKNTPVKK